MEAKGTMNFLSNIPEGNDLFEGKSQEKIADVITGVLKTKDFQIIGIDGAWGTGKSNLVKMVNKKLPDYKFFIYDVWGHQEDDQRRAILIELTEFISNKNNSIVSNKQKWQNKLKRLLSKEREITVINRPYLSIGFIFSLFSIIYIPSVNALKDSNFFGVKTLLGKSILVFFPLIIVLGIFIYNFMKAIYNSEKGNPFKIAAEKTFQVYTNKQEEETKIESISENEPSVKDFRAWMKEIDSDLKDTKLVLVFDNFDRLPKRHILSIWSSIHIFFAEEKYNNIKVIIPFDRMHIRNAFKELNGDGNNDYANDYINKTFDLVYRVSQPILSNWKIFFENCWKKAFGNIDKEEEFHKVLQIYETYRTTITPRELISFINEIISIKSLDNTIPDRYIALFILHKDTLLADPLKAITQPDFLQGLTYLYGDDEDFQKFITALIYQIKSDDALEVAYKKQLKDSLVNNKASIFIEISKTNVFNTIIGSVIDEIENYENPIEVLDLMDMESKISEAQKSNLWDRIYFKVINSFHDTFKIVEYQKIIIKHIPKEKAVQWIKAILKKLRSIDSFETIRFCEIIDDFQLYLMQDSISIDIYKLLEDFEIKDVTPGDFLDLIEQKKQLYPQYRFNTSVIELNKYLTTLSLDNLEGKKSLKFIKNEFDLNDFETNLLNRVSENKSNPLALHIIYQILKDIGNKPFERKLDDVDIYSIRTSIDASHAFYHDLVALRLSRFNHYNSSYSSVFDIDMSNSDDEIAEKVAEIIEYYIDYTNYLIEAKDYSSSELCKKVALKIINNDYGESKGDLKTLLINFEQICSNLQIPANDLLRDLERFDNSVLTSDMIKEFPIYLFEVLQESDTILKGKLLDLANESFTNLNKEGWKTIFENFENHDFKLIQAINFKDWNSYSIEAFKETLLSAIVDKSFQNKIEWQWVLESFNASGKSIINILKDIRDKIYNDSSIINKELFSFLIHYFIKFKVLNDNSSEAFRTFFQTDFLDDSDIFDEILKYKQELKPLIDNSDKEATDTFKQAIKDRSKEDNKFEELRKFLKL